MRINNAGHYEYCRWADKNNRTQTARIQEVLPQTFFQQHMTATRQQLLNGEQPQGCGECAVMEQHHKVSGRQRQLLKVGVRLEQFEKTMASSPWFDVFANPNFEQLPQDWQIDLGNYCNSACIFCDPLSSSRLAAEWKKIGFIDQLPPPNWSDDPALIQRLVDTLKHSKHIQYLHFIGGETLITPAFATILQALIQVGLNRTATIGFTTNLSVWDDNVVALLEQFENVNLGMSVESFSIVNDYVRWPVCLTTVFENLDRWQSVARQNSWLMQLRITPTCLTVGSLLPIYDYALTHGMAVESCNFLQRPQILRPSVLPPKYRSEILENMQAWIDKHATASDIVINIRNPNMVKDQLIQDLRSYANYLQNEPDLSDQLPALVSWLKKIEAGRGNCVIDYLPQYEELFRSAGY